MVGARAVLDIMETICLPVESRLRSRAEKVQLFVNLAAGLPLLDAGSQLVRGGRVLLGGTALAAFGALAVATYSTLRRGPGFPLMGTADLFAGTVLLLTALLPLWSGSGDWSPSGLAGGVVLLILGIFHRPLERRKARRRSLTIDQLGFRLRPSRLRSVEATWEELQRLSVEGERLVVTTGSGERRSLGLRDLVNRDAILALLREHLEARMVDCDLAGLNPSSPGPGSESEAISGGG